MPKKFSKKYYKKKNKENYELNKKMSDLYKTSGISGEPFTKFKKRMKKDKGFWF